MSIDNQGWRARALAAAAIARAVGVIAKRRFLDRGSFTVTFKGPQDFLTEVDSEAERLIAGRLQEAFPEDGFIGEEGARRAAEAGAPTWVVDPIDGTSNFARGAPHFCVSIAAIVEKEIEIGVIYNPMLDELFFARKGEGAFLNGQRMRPSSTRALQEAAIEVGWNARGGADLYLGLLQRVLATGAVAYRTGSGALGLAYVASGRRDGYAETFMRPWDCLAGILLVREAGGYVSDYLAGQALAKGGPILAAAPGVRDALIAAAAIPGLAP